MSEDKPPEIAAAYKEAKSRGLPDGWTCTIDVRAGIMVVAAVVFAK